MDRCDVFYTDYMQTVEYGRSLEEMRLLKPNRVKVETKNGCCFLLDGFRTIDEKAFRTLPAAAVIDWYEKGWLDLIMLCFSSQQSWYLSLAEEMSVRIKV